MPCVIDARIAHSVLVLPLVSTCLADPVHDRDVAQLGGETPGVPAGPLHRPGQPCSACHDSEGPATARFSLAGTVYREAATTAALEGATVRVIDWTGAQYATTTNCAGNFFVRDTDFAPSWPVWVKVEYAGQTAEMISAAFRETSCNACHADPASPSTVGHVYLAQAGSVAGEAGCP